MADEAHRPPRVLFVIGRLEVGGSEGQLVTLLEETHGTRLHAGLAAIAPADDKRHTRRVEQLGLPFMVLGSGGSRTVRIARTMRALLGVLRRFRPDIVYPWLEEAALVAGPPARLLGIPLIIARRNVSGPYSERPAPVIAAIHAAERLALLATANSEAVVAETVRRGIPAERVRLVRNGQRLPEPGALPSAGVVTLGYLARMRPEKGHLRLLRALAALQTATPWRVMLGGDGPLQKEVESEALRLGLTDRLVFLGAISDANAFWAECDVAVLLSDHEGSPNALIEAALMGRPIVATRVGGVPELVDPEMGILVDPRDDGGIAHALKTIVEDRPLRGKLGEQARRRTAERHDLAAFVEGHCDAVSAALALAGR